VLGWWSINQRRVIAMWNIISGLIFYYVILPTWRRSGIKAGRPRARAVRWV
jgi:hypothetical protein